jgi:hypothetical protein
VGVKVSRLCTPNAYLMMHGSPAIVGHEHIEAFWAEDFLEENPLTVSTVTHLLKGVDMVLVHSKRSRGVLP